jgi:uncharacterized membrane protein
MIEIFLYFVVGYIFSVLFWILLYTEEVYQNHPIFSNIVLLLLWPLFVLVAVAGMIKGFIKTLFEK